MFALMSDTCQPPCCAPPNLLGISSSTRGPDSKSAPFPQKVKKMARRDARKSLHEARSSNTKLAENVTAYPQNSAAKISITRWPIHARYRVMSSNQEGYQAVCYGSSTFMRNHGMQSGTVMCFQQRRTLSFSPKVLRYAEAGTSRARPSLTFGVLLIHKVGEAGKTGIFLYLISLCNPPRHFIPTRLCRSLEESQGYRCWR